MGSLEERKTLKRSKDMKKKRPYQQVYSEADGSLRFMENKIVRFLLEAGPYDLEELDLMPFSRKDRIQFAQLIGSHLECFGRQPYVSEKMWRRACLKGIGANTSGDC